MINNKYKTALCKHFEQGNQCHMGARCHFAHGKGELRSMNDPLPPNSPVMGMPAPQIQTAPIQGGQAPSSNYKTMKCKFFEKGYCRYEQNCSFAHGDEDLRQPMGKYPNAQGPSSGGMPMNSMMPMYDANMVTLQQIQFMSSKLEEYHADNPDLIAQIKKANEINSNGNLQEAAALLDEIMKKNSKSIQDVEQYEKIRNKTQEYGNSLMQQLQAQQYSQMSLPQTGGMNQMGYSPMGNFGGAPDFNPGYQGGGHGGHGGHSGHSGQHYKKGQDRGGYMQGQDGNMGQVDQMGSKGPYGGGMMSNNNYMMGPGASNYGGFQGGYQPGFQGGFEGGFRGGYQGGYQGGHLGGQG